MFLFTMLTSAVGRFTCFAVRRCVTDDRLHGIAGSCTETTVVDTADDCVIIAGDVITEAEAEVGPYG